MANRTVSDAIAIHGTNPQYLIEKIMRTRIYESLYWKEFCFGLTAETLIDRAVELTSFGGEYGNQKPTEFLCLILKLLQLQPSKEIVMEFIRNEDYKYLRILGAFYLRLVGNSVEIYQTLEPLLNDYRKLRKRTSDGDIEIVCVDEFIDELLKEERSCDTILPRILKRHVLEENGELPPRESALQDIADEEAESSEIKSEGQEEEDQEGEEEEEGEVKSRSSKSRERSKKDKSLSRDRGDKSNSKRNRSYSRSRSPPPRRSRSRSRSPLPRRSKSISRSPKRRDRDWRADRYVPGSSRSSRRSRSRRHRRVSYSPSRSHSRSRSRSRSYDRYEPSYRRDKSFSSSTYRPSRHRSYSRSRSR